MDKPYEPFDDDSHNFQLSDPAVERVELDMLELEAEYIQSDGAMSNEEIEARVHQLHEQWPHTGDQARVSGPISTRSTDEKLLSRLAKQWGDRTEGTEFSTFIVNDQPLVSCGLWGARIDQPDDSSNLQIFHSYLDETTNTMFVARPIESTAVYETLSFEAIDDYLHEQYPDVMEAVEQALAPTTHNPTLKLHRLHEVIASLDTSKWPDTKVEWLRRYTEPLIDLDPEWPYLARVQGDVIVHEPNFHHEITMDEPYEFWAKYASFWLDKSKDKRELIASICFKQPHDAHIIVPLSSITRLQSSMTQLSIGEQIQSGRDHGEAPARASATPPRATIIERDDTPPRHEVLSERQRVLEAIQAQVIEARRQTYETKEEATEACRLLSDDIMRQLYEQTIMGSMLEVSGSEVYGMDSQPMSSWSTTEKETLTMGTLIHFEDSNNAFVKINPDYVMRGTLTGICPTYEPCNDGDETVYIVSPQLIIDDPAIETYTIPGIQPALVELRLTRKISVGLARGNTIALEEYQQRKRRNQTLHEFHATHQDHPAAPLLNRLHQALHHLDDDLFIEMGKPQLVSTLGELIEQEPDEATATDIIEALKVLLVNRDEMTLHGDIPLAGGRALTSQIKGSFRSVFTAAPRDGSQQREAWMELEDAMNQLHQVRLATVQSLSL